VRVTPGRLHGLLVVEPDVFRDERGFFLETFSRLRLAEAGIDVDFVQDNHSRSVRDTVRGLHFQAGAGQAKLVRVARGGIWDVAVDIRQDSPTFGKWEAFNLDDEANRQLFIPAGFAHGFCALSDLADVCYKVSAPYDAALERGVRWDDPRIGISWPTSHPHLSDRDRNNPPLEEAIA
jgi:dTDP-4-dehydrorhamnose 3,5-epimerase